MSELQRALFRLLVFPLSLWSGAAHAYNRGGHYYTLVALIDSAPKSTVNLNPNEQKLEAFCAELPDMAFELDATSLRIAVFRSRSDRLWALTDRISNDSLVLASKILEQTCLTISVASRKAPTMPGPSSMSMSRSSASV